MQSWLGNQERRWVYQGHMSPPEETLAPAGRNTLPFLDTARSLLRPSCFVRAVPGPHPQLSLPDSVWLPLPHLCRCLTKPSKGSFPRAPGLGHPPASAAVPRPPSSELLSHWATSAVSLSGFLCPLRTRPRLVSSLNFQHQGLSWLISVSVNVC